MIEMTEHKLAALAVALLLISLMMTVCAVDAAPVVFQDQSYCVDELDTCYIPLPPIPLVGGYYDTGTLEYPLHSDGSKWEKLEAKIDWQNAHAQYKYLLYELNAEPVYQGNSNSALYNNCIRGTFLQGPYDFVCEHPYLAAYAAAHAVLDIKHIGIFFME